MASASLYKFRIWGGELRSIKGPGLSSHAPREPMQPSAHVHSTCMCAHPPPRGLTSRALLRSHPLCRRCVLLVLAVSTITPLFSLFFSFLFFLSFSHSPPWLACASALCSLLVPSSFPRRLRPGLDSFLSLQDPAVIPDRPAADPPRRDAVERPGG